MADSLTTDPNIYMLESSDIYGSNLDSYKLSIYKNNAYRITEQYPQFEDFAIFSNRDGRLPSQEKVDWAAKTPIAATSNFAKLINIPMIEGSIDEVLNSVDKVALTRSYATELYGTENPIGKSFEWITGENSWINGVSQTKHNSYTVAAIIDDSKDRLLNFSALYPMDSSELNSRNQLGHYFAVYKLKKDASIDELTQSINADSTLNYNDLKYRFTKTKDIYFSESNDSLKIFKSRNKDTLLIGLTISFIVLLIAAFNYINLTLARAPRRLKNLAGQRIMGASKWGVRWQIMTDTALNVVMGLALAAIFAQPALEAFNSFIGADVKMIDFVNFNNVGYILLMLGVLIIFPSIVLTLKLSSGNPLLIFKNPRGGGVLAMQTLTIAQLVISIVLIAFSINATRQIGHITSAIEDANKIMYIELSDYDDQNELNQGFIDAIKSSSTTLASTPNGELRPGASYAVDNFSFMLHGNIEPNYFDFYRIPILSGRTFDSVKNETMPNVVVNEAFVRKREIEGDPLGYEFVYSGERKYRIVGVCRDFAFDKATVEVSPMVFAMRDTKNRPWAYAVRFSGSEKAKRAEIEELYQKYTPQSGEPLKIRTIEDYYKRINNESVRLKTIVEFFTLVSVFLTAFGLFGLAWYTVERRKKEVAIRRVFGGSTPRLIALLCRSFAVWVIIAIVIALPIGYWLSGYWLEGFVYRIDNSIWTLALTALIAAALTFVTVIFQTYRAATTNPASVVKSE